MMSPVLQGLLFKEIEKVIIELQNLPATDQSSLEATRKLLALRLSVALATAITTYLNSPAVFTNPYGAPSQGKTLPAPGPVAHFHIQTPHKIVAK